MIAERGEHPGLVPIFPAMESCPTRKIRNRKGRSGVALFELREFFDRFVEDLPGK